MYYLVTNPASRSGKGQESLIRRLEEALRARGREYRILTTRQGGDAEELAAAGAGYDSRDGGEEDTVVVIGGDGTINHVINAIPDVSRIRFGFLPAGSANDLARGLGIRDISRDPGQEDNIRSIAEGQVRRTMDLGQMEYSGRSRRFAVSAGIGFDAAVCRASDTSRMRKLFNSLHMGALTYGVVALHELLTAPKTPCRISLSSGREFQIHSLIFATFMNTPYEGGGYKFAPDAVCDDGCINAAAIGDLSKAKVLVNFPSAHKGTYYHVRGVYHAMAPQIRVRAASPLWIHTDGEVLGQESAFAISCLPHCLRLVM